MSLHLRASRQSPYVAHEDERDVLNVLRHCYVRESQHALRYRQHAERIHNPKLHDDLLGIADEEQKHVQALSAAIRRLGADIPEVIPVHIAKEENCWLYLRTDLEEEERCAGELKNDLLLIEHKSPEIASLLNQIDADCHLHYHRVRALMANTDPLSPTA